VSGLDLDAIRARADAATEGPWECEPAAFGPRWFVYNASRGLAGDVRPDDAIFIAHARSDVPALVGEVEHLRAENAKLSALYATLRSQVAQEQGCEPMGAAAFSGGGENQP